MKHAYNAARVRGMRMDKSLWM